MALCAVSPRLSTTRWRPRTPETDSGGQKRASGQAAGESGAERPQRQQHRKVSPRSDSRFRCRREVGDGQPDIADAAKADVHPEVDGRMGEPEFDHGESVSASRPGAVSYSATGTGTSK